MMQQLLIGIGMLCVLAQCVCWHRLKTGVRICSASCTLLNEEHFSRALHDAVPAVWCSARSLKASYIHVSASHTSTQHSSWRNCIHAYALKRVYTHGKLQPKGLNMMRFIN